MPSSFKENYREELKDKNNCYWNANKTFMCNKHKYQKPITILFSHELYTYILYYIIHMVMSTHILYYIIHMVMSTHNYTVLYYTYGYVHTYTVLYYTYGYVHLFTISYFIPNGSEGCLLHTETSLEGHAFCHTPICESIGVSPTHS